MRHPILSTAALAVAVVLTASSPAGAAPNLLVNGGFESSSSATTTPPGWTNIGHMDGVLTYANTATPVYEGLNYYDLGGAGNSGNVAVGEGIAQSVATAIGSSYQLTFGYSGENVSGSGPETLRVSIGGSSFDFVIAVDGTGVFKRAFTTQVLNYVATGLNTAISFTLASAPNGSGNNDPMVDGVSFSLVAPRVGVPEPETLALLGLGVATLAAMRRRRASRAKA